MERPGQDREAAELSAFLENFEGLGGGGEAVRLGDGSSYRGRSDQPKSNHVDTWQSRVHTAQALVHLEGYDGVRAVRAAAPQPGENGPGYSGGPGQFGASGSGLATLEGMDLTAKGKLVPKATSPNSGRRAASRASSRGAPERADEQHAPTVQRGRRPLERGVPERSLEVGCHPQVAVRGRGQGGGGEWPALADDVQEYNSKTKPGDLIVVSDEYGVRLERSPKKSSVSIVK